MSLLLILCLFYFGYPPVCLSNSPLHQSQQLTPHPFPIPAKSTQMKSPKGSLTRPQSNKVKQYKIPTVIIHNPNKLGLNGTMVPEFLNLHR